MNSRLKGIRGPPHRKMNFFYFDVGHSPIFVPFKMGSYVTQLYDYLCEGGIVKIGQNALFRQIFNFDINWDGSRNLQVR